MKSINLFCFGFGQVAKSFVNKLSSKNFKINLSTTSRDKTCQKKINNISYNNYKLDGDHFDLKLIEELKQSDHILTSIPPINGTDIVIKNFSKIIKKCNSKWITYLSATSVYGNHNGEWVDEQSEVHPTSKNGKDRLIAEKDWMSLSHEEKMPIQIFRLSGIYSSKNSPLARLKSGNASIIKKTNHFFSRIHIDDIANILFKSLSSFKSKEIYNISDDKPASSEEVMLYAVKILNVPKPKRINVEGIQSEMLRNFYKDSKKVCNNKMKKFFDYDLKFPTYVEGLNNIRDNLT